MKHILYFLVTLAYIQTAYCANSSSVYSTQQIKEHKEKSRIIMLANAQKPGYQINRALSTLFADDTDYIPKVPNAGLIFPNEPTPYQLMHNGIKIVLNSYYDAQWLTDVIYGLKGHHEPQEEKCFYEVLKYMPENATMIELGSYWAYYSLWFASQIKNSKNYMIEPDQKRLEIGQKNFELNNKVGTFKRGFIGTVSDRDPDITNAESISIDNFIDQQGIKHVNILHSDIQGAEFEMLTAIVKHLDIIDYFFISTHGPRNHYSCLNFFKTHQFIILAEIESDSGCNDGLIVAKRKGVMGPDQIDLKKY